MDVFFRGFHGKTSTPSKIELVSLFYTFARRLYDTQNCEVPFQNRTSTTQSMHQVVLDVILFAYCQLTVALISLKLFPFVQCMRYKVVYYLVLAYEFLNYLLSNSCLSQTNICTNLTIAPCRYYNTVQNTRRLSAHFSHPPCYSIVSIMFYLYVIYGVRYVRGNETSQMFIYLLRTGIHLMKMKRRAPDTQQIVYVRFQT